MPSACDASCASSTCVPPGTPPPAGAVGTYEGGMYSDCNVYRPLPSCYMRDYAPFCPVVRARDRQVLATFLPAESITPLTASIEFTNIPEGIGGTGITTYRAVTFEVVTCRSLTFRFTAGPTGGFGTPLGTSVTTGAAEIGPIARSTCGSGSLYYGRRHGERDSHRPLRRNRADVDVEHQRRTPCRGRNRRSCSC